MTPADIAVVVIDISIATISRTIIAVVVIAVINRPHADAYTDRACADPHALRAGRH
jgi:hypothetical protein